MSISAAIVGASGFTGGELLRLLLGHPSIEAVQITSRRLAGHPAHRAHPHLRGLSDLVFEPAEEVRACDVVFLCLPHGEAQREIDRYLGLARVVVDLSADFRLRDAGEYEAWYGEAHARPELLQRAVYGLCETSRGRIREGGEAERESARARLISGVGCNATAMILALLPLARAGLVRRAIADIKVGSSEGGAEATDASHHPIRAGATRTYSIGGHRHLAEVRQALGAEIDVDATVTSIELVRGVLCTAHVEPSRPVDEREVRRLYREAYAREPFVRVVSERSGLHRLPDPKVLVGSNFADVGFGVDARSGRIVALCAIDNLVKGAAGSAIQAANVALALEETAGLRTPGVFPA